MRRFVVAAAVAAVCALDVTVSRPAGAEILVNISKASQRMSVLVDGSAKYNWVVTTGAARYTTPNGVYSPQWLARKWRSKKYNNAPMPHSIFFYEGYAIHGTTEVARLGKIGSHGCVRLHPDNAAKLYSLVEHQMAKTRIVVSNDVIEAPGEAPKKKPSQHVAENPAGADPIAAPPIELATVGESAEISVPESPLVAEKVADARETAKPRPARTEKVARASTVGFRW
jgi:hypothetical protein